MFQRSIVALLGAAFLLASPLAYAKKDGANTGGKSPQHMSGPGQMNTNSPTMGQEKGMMRSDERKSTQGQAHDQAGDPEKKANKGKSKGHDK